jgi:hypothetical protein
MEAHPPAQRSWPLRLIAHRLVCGVRVRHRACSVSVPAA